MGGAAIGISLHGPLRGLHLPVLGGAHRALPVMSMFSRSTVLIAMRMLPYVRGEDKDHGRSRLYVSLDWGLMQINEGLESLDPAAWDLERIKQDPTYNLRAAVAILESKRAYLRRLRRQANWKTIEARYHLRGHSRLDILLKAYNGFQPSWVYVQRVKAALAQRPWEQAMLRELTDAALWPETTLPDADDPVARLAQLGPVPAVCTATGTCLAVLSDAADRPYHWPALLE